MLLMLGLIFSVLSAFSDYNIDEYAMMNNGNSQNALAKCILAIGAQIDNNPTQYNILISEMNKLLEQSPEMHKRRQFWKDLRNIFAILALLSNVIATILNNQLKENGPTRDA